MTKNVNTLNLIYTKMRGSLGYLIVPSPPFLLLGFLFQFCYVFVKNVPKEALFPNEPAQGHLITLYFMTSN